MQRQTGADPNEANRQHNLHNLLLTRDCFVAYIACNDVLVILRLLLGIELGDLYHGIWAVIS